MSVPKPGRIRDASELKGSREAHDAGPMERQRSRGERKTAPETRRWRTGARGALGSRAAALRTGDPGQGRKTREPAPSGSPMAYDAEEPTVFQRPSSSQGRRPSREGLPNEPGSADAGAGARAGDDKPSSGRAPAAEGAVRPRQRRGQCQPGGQQALRTGTPEPPGELQVRQGGSARHRARRGKASRGIKEEAEEEEEEGEGEEEYEVEGDLDMGLQQRSGAEKVARRRVGAGRAQREGPGGKGWRRWFGQSPTRAASQGAAAAPAARQRPRQGRSQQPSGEREPQGVPRGRSAGAGKVRGAERPSARLSSHKSRSSRRRQLPCRGAGRGRGSDPRGPPREQAPAPVQQRGVQGPQRQQSSLPQPRSLRSTAGWRALWQNPTRGPIRDPGPQTTWEVSSGASPVFQYRP